MLQQLLLIDLALATLPVALGAWLSRARGAHWLPLLSALGVFAAAWHIFGQPDLPPRSSLDRFAVLLLGLGVALAVLPRALQAVAGVAALAYLGISLLQSREPLEAWPALMALPALLLFALPPQRARWSIIELLALAAVAISLAALQFFDGSTSGARVIVAISFAAGAGVVLHHAVGVRLSAAYALLVLLLFGGQLALYGRLSVYAMAAWFVGVALIVGARRLGPARARFIVLALGGAALIGAVVLADQLAEPAGYSPYG